MKKTNQAISAGHQKTLEAAKEVLQAGGNAVDAAIAAYWMSFVSEPCMASAGAGGFAMVRMDGEIRNVDFFCQTPMEKRDTIALDFFGVDVDFGSAIETFHVGKGSSAVPGTIAGIFAMHDRWGTVPMAELANQAIQAAKEGIPLDKFQAQDFILLKDIFAIDQEQKSTFFNGDVIKGEGDLIALPDYADFLEALVRDGKDLFYKGEIAATIANDYSEGGQLTRVDFEHYRVNIGSPIAFKYRDHEVYTTPMPSVGGLIVGSLLKLRESSEHANRFLSYDHLSLNLASCKEVYQASKDRHTLIQSLAKYANVVIPPTWHPNSGNQTKGTSHFSIIDRHGNAVGLTTSIGEGNGYFIPGTQMQMNNMLGEGALLPNGFHSWIENTRLRSMMTPCMAVDAAHDISLIIGSGGAGRIPYAIAQVIENVLDYRQSLREAINAPRVYFDGSTYQIEAGYDYPSLPQEYNVWQDQTLYFGGTNCIALHKGRYTALADPRRFGAEWQED